MIALQKIIERRTGLLIFGILVVASIGGLVQIVPPLFQPSLRTPAPGVKPYGALQLAGRDVYIRESCGLCHSQQIRPLLAEVKRYGPRSQPGEFAYDRPFLWGSKRTGPDLHRIGGKYSDEWHRLHLIDPRSVVPTSIMPAYPWLEQAPLQADVIAARMRALRRLGHPYSDEDVEGVAEAVAGRTELDAVVAYLQGLGLQAEAQP